MKKSYLSIVYLLLLAGCQSALTSLDTPAGQKVPETKSAVAEWAGLMYNLRVEAAQTALKYLPPQEGGMSRALGSKPELSAVLDLLPSDFSSLKRVVPQSNSRNAEAPITVTLDQEWTALVQNFDATVESILPDTTLAETLPGVVIRDGNLIVEGDVTVPLNSAHGMSLIEALNAQARGEDPNLIMARIQKELEAKALELGLTDTRGLTKTEYQNYKNQKWPNGRIEYWMVGMAEGHAKMVRDAMDEWQTKTGKIQFVPRTLDNGSYWQRYWGNIQVLEIKDVSGLGPQGRTSYDRDDMDLNKENDKFAGDYLFTAKHELGHVLGLEHEFARADRDNYVESYGFLYFGTSGTPIGGDAYKIIPEFKTIWWWEYTPQQGWWGIWYPAWTYREAQERVSTMVGKFDFHSVMMYPSNIFEFIFPKKIKDNARPFGEESDTYKGITTVYAGPRISDTSGPTFGKWMIDQDTLFITARDAETVKRIFP